MARFFDIYWNGLLGYPLGWVERFLGMGMNSSAQVNAWKIGITVVLALIVLFILRSEVYLRIKRARERKQSWDDSLLEQPDTSEAGGLATSPQDAAAMIARLKKEKQFSKLGEVYSSLGKHKDAARAHQRAGDLKRASNEWAKAGKPLKAARLLEKADDHASAAKFYAEKGKHLKAARAFKNAGILPSAALEFSQARKHDEAARLFTEYFGSGKDEPEVRAQAAEICHKLLADDKFKAKVDEAQQKALLAGVAGAYEVAEKNDLAAQLFRQVGQPAKAGEIYLRAGMLELAAQCMKEAGNEKEAARIGGRYYESKGLWKEAGAAYQGAGDFIKAGDAFSKANDAIRAAGCYEKGGEFFGAGFALVHASKWEGGIRMFQQVAEDHVNFNESRALLGRCFYELKDYAHAAAALENHLTGERVRSNNVDYFWMLALAWEQEGELTKSKDLLLKIRSVNVGYRDVAQRLSSIDTRISMAPQQASIGATTPSPAVPGSKQATAVMTMVEESVGERYKLERELGRGGMGVVYMARDTQLDRPVALKFLGALVDGNEEFKLRFQREAKAAAKVNHPNIISIYDIGTKEGKAYIAMEFIEGRDLLKYLSKQGKLSPREAINIIVQSCSALEAVHGAGIVHRDIKPDNIVLTKGGLVKVMDFGLAMAKDMRLTGANVVMGTPSYMSPEQAQAKDVDRRTDIYSLGLVMHELLTGETYFTEGNVLERQISEMPAPPSQRVEGVPEALDAAIMKSVQKAQEDRFQSAQEFANALRSVKL